MLAVSLYLYVTTAFDNLANHLRNRDQKGQVAAEYLGVLVVVGGIVAALMTTNVGSTIGDHLKDVVTKIFNGGK